MKKPEGYVNTTRNTSLNSLDYVSLKGEGALKSCMLIQLFFDVLLGRLHRHLLCYLPGV